MITALVVDPSRAPVQLPHLLAQPGAGPETGTSGAIALIESGSTGPAASPQPARHSESCAVEAAYTIRPSPTHACAAEHIGQCSPEV